MTVTLTLGERRDGDEDDAVGLSHLAIGSACAHVGVCLYVIRVCSNQ